jgi:hypothetical protein
MTVILESLVVDPREPSRQYHRWERDFERRQALRRASLDAPCAPVRARRSRALRLLAAIRFPRRLGSEVANAVKRDVVY